jgi:hypothetical protein
MGQIKKKRLEVLRRDWEVNTRKELLKTLDKMEYDGHANILKHIKQIITEIIEEKGSLYN